MNRKNIPSEVKYLDKPHIRVAVPANSKIPVVDNWINYSEVRSIIELLQVGNYGLRTGTKLGNYYFCALDIDQKGEQYHFPQISYVESYKGRHYYLLLKTLPDNIPLFYQGEKIGRLMSRGKQVIGSGSVHPAGIIYRWVEKEEFFLKLNDVKQLAAYLDDYGIILEN